MTAQIAPAADKSMIRLALFLLLIGVPLAEIALFVVVGERIGILATIAIVIATAMAGTGLLRFQGLQVLAEAQASMERGETPVAPLADGICLFAAGLLLITPGFLTDAVGFALFVPAFRRRLAALVWRAFRPLAHVEIHGMDSRFARNGKNNDAGKDAGMVIEGEIVDEPRDDAGHGENGDSPWSRQR